MSFIDWKDIFDDIFEAYPDRWKLTWVHRNDTSQLAKLQGRGCFKKKGYARFHCTRCSHHWTSAQAMAYLYYPSSKQRNNTITLRFFGQQCRRCFGNRFADSDFDDESIRYTLEKVFERVGWFFYDKEKPPLDTAKKDKKNNIQGPHQAALCEACRLGVCDQNTELLFSYK